MKKRRVGIVGFGNLGKFLVKKIRFDPYVSQNLEVAFVWNRSKDKIACDVTIPKELILENLSEFATRKPGFL
jgi:predicted dinucleotide-utilizing enzyme